MILANLTYKLSSSRADNGGHMGARFFRDTAFGDFTLGFGVLSRLMGCWLL